MCAQRYTKSTAYANQKAKYAYIPPLSYHTIAAIGMITERKTGFGHMHAQTLKSRPDKNDSLNCPQQEAYQSIR